MWLRAMQIKIVTVGKLKEKYWQDAVSEYVKRLDPFTRLEIHEIAEERISDNPGAAEIQQGKVKEGERILKLLSPAYFVIPLVISGKQFSSEELSGILGRLALEGKSQLAFIIGGSHGLSEEVVARGNLQLSFSTLTFPHQLMRVILLEQIYRSYKILNGEPYHK